MTQLSSPNLLAQLRLNYQPKLPLILKNLGYLTAVPAEKTPLKEINKEQLKQKFPLTFNQPILNFHKAAHAQYDTLRVGVVFSGGQAAGGHNVITGLFDALKKLNQHSALIGFRNGPIGILENSHIEITEEILASYRNQGGFDLIGAGRTKIETPEQLKAAKATVDWWNLDGLVIVGGDDSNTNAAVLAEYFLANECKTHVIGVPKTIDGDLKNEFIEVSFGFDTATKTYSEFIGNILRDSLSAKKYYFFIKLMGRSASHIALECALQTHPNLTLISEEVEAKGKTILDITREICDIIHERSLLGKDYGVILIPEGIIEFIPECKQLIKELNTLLNPDKSHQQKIEALSTHEEKVSYVLQLLSQASANCLKSIPSDIQMQLLLDRDPHGNVQVSKIESERLFIETVKKELKQRKEEGKYLGSFSAQPLFFGYEGRSCLPSNFDSQYCYALGHVAALLVASGATGYMSCIRNLCRPVEDWMIAGIPLITMMHIEERKGKLKPVIRKALVDLEGKPFQVFREERDRWLFLDEYFYPGPIQFFGPSEVTDRVPVTLELELKGKEIFANKP